MRSRREHGAGLYESYTVLIDALQGAARKTHVGTFRQEPDVDSHGGGQRSFQSPPQTEVNARGIVVVSEDRDRVQTADFARWNDWVVGVV